MRERQPLEMEDFDIRWRLDRDVVPTLNWSDIACYDTGLARSHDLRTSGTSAGSNQSRALRLLRRLRRVRTGAQGATGACQAFIGILVSPTERPWVSSTVNSIQIVHPTTSYTSLYHVSRPPSTPSKDSPESNAP
jgi:hypothetical protein